jgi:hypothetical protein
MLRRREVPLEVHVDHGVPLLLAHVHEHPVAEDPRVVDEDVEPPELFQSLFDQAARYFFVGEVADDGQRASPGAHDRLAGRLGAARVAVAGHVRARLRERRRHRRAQPRRSSRHERRPAVQPECVKNHPLCSEAPREREARPSHYSLNSPEVFPRTLIFYRPDRK